MALFHRYKMIGGKMYLPPYQQLNGPLRMLDDEVDAAWVQFRDKKVSLSWLIRSIVNDPLFTVRQLLFEELDVFFLPYLLNIKFAQSLVIKRLVGDVNWAVMAECFRASELNQIAITVKPSVAAAAVDWDVTTRLQPLALNAKKHKSWWMDVVVSPTQIYRDRECTLFPSSNSNVVFDESDLFNPDGSVLMDLAFNDYVEVMFCVTENVSRLLEGKFKALHYNHCWVAHVDVCNNLNGLVTCYNFSCGIQVVRDVELRRTRQECKAFVSSIKKVLHVDEHLLRYIGTFLGVGKGWIK
jgi:hypothetical protein